MPRAAAVLHTAAMPDATGSGGAMKLRKSIDFSQDLTVSFSREAFGGVRGGEDFVRKIILANFRDLP